MLTTSQIQVLRMIAERRRKEGPACYLETRAIFNRLMEGALFADRTMTRQQFMQEAMQELAK